MIRLQYIYIIFSPLFYELVYSQVKIYLDVTASENDAFG